MREEVAATDGGRGALRFYGRWEAVKKRGGARASVRSAADQLAIGEIPFEGGCYVMERKQSGIPLGARCVWDTLKDALLVAILAASSHILLCNKVKCARSSEVAGHLKAEHRFGSVPRLSSARVKRAVSAVSLGTIDAKRPGVGIEKPVHLSRLRR